MENGEWNRERTENRSPDGRSRILVRLPSVRPPELRTADPQDRHATWLALFFDLVFVVAVAELAHMLSTDVSGGGAMRFVALFVPVWWAWVGSTFYANRFDTDDLEYRALTALEMVAVVALAVNIHGAFGATADGFALSYAAIRGVLVLKYVRAYLAVFDACPLTRRYAIGFGVGAGIWVASVFVSPPAQFVLWGLGLAVSFSTTLTAGRHHLDFAPHHEHLPERFGLFTIIVLGESFIGVVGGVAGRDWTISAGLIATFGVALAFSLWWIYFEHVGSGAIEAAKRLGRTWIYQLWLYAHFPVVVTLTAVGVGVGVGRILAGSETTVTNADVILITSPLAGYFGTLAVLHASATRVGNEHSTLVIGSLVATGGGLVVLAAFLDRVSPLGLMGFLAGAATLQVLVEVLTESGIEADRETASGGAGSSEPTSREKDSP